MERYLPESILGRTDKMGFPVPFVEWAKGPAKDFVWDMLSSQAACSREYIDNRKAIEKIDGESAFGRNIWGLLSLELWQREFIDKAAKYRALVDESHG
jgi:asparagine synthase (glutamine-hydrolysing)